MSAIYLDSSVLLRWLFQEEGAFHPPPPGARLVSSRLLVAETHRVLDRMGFAQGKQRAKLSRYSSALHQWLEYLAYLPISEELNQRTSLPFRSPLSTLDGIHLATALAFQSKGVKDLLLMNHDSELAEAARSEGISVYSG